MLDIDNELYLEIEENIDIGILPIDIFEELSQNNLKEEHFEELETLIEIDNIAKIQDYVRNAEADDQFGLLEMYAWIEGTKFI